jgi:hypothetical protein
MILTARAAAPFLLLGVLPVTALAQTGPADPQVIAGAPTAKITMGSKKFGGHVIATVRVTPDGHVSDVLITENTTEAGLEPQLIKVLQSARFRPAIDAAGKPAEGSIEMKVELRQSTANEPKPVANKSEADQNGNEKARIKKMRCADFLWEWELLRDAASDPATEFMPRIATTMYKEMRTAAGDYVDAKVWKAAPRAFKESASQCKDNPSAPFWDGVFKTVMDEAVPK